MSAPFARKHLSAEGLLRTARQVFAWLGIPDVPPGERVPGMVLVHGGGGTAFPEWVEITVYRLVGNQRCPFTAQVYWLETYAREGGQWSALPTDMWVRRPRGQAVKCCEAAALRAAFPEEATYTAEEMEGKVIEADTSIPVQRGPEVVTGAASVNETNAQEPTMEAKEHAEPESGPDQASQRASDTPTPPPDPDTLDPSMRERIDKVVARAAGNAAWKQAEQYLRARCDGADLTYALATLSKAQTNPEQQQAA